MTQKPNLSRDDTERFLAEKCSAPISELTLLTGGEWSQAYSYVCDDQKYVLRWCKSSETFEKDAFAARFNSRALPIPKILDRGEAYGQFFAISKYADGASLELLNAAELARAVPAIFGVLDSLRAANLSGTTGYGNWDKNGIGEHNSWRDFLLDVNNDSRAITRGWYTNLKQSEGGSFVFDGLYAELEARLDVCPEARELIHSDLLHYNVLVNNAEISAVIDWQCALYGDALYDITRFVFYAPWYPQFETVGLCQKLLDHYKATALDARNIEERLLCYQLHIGLGSIAYNAFKKDWKAVDEVGEYTKKVLSNQ